MKLVVHNKIGYTHQATSKLFVPPMYAAGFMGSTR